MDGTERRIEDACASLAMEGLIVTEEEKELGRKCIRHEMTYDEAIAMMIAKYSEKPSV